MKKKALRLLGLLCATLMLCGCNRLYQQRPPEPLSQNVTNNGITTNTALPGNGSVSLTAGKQGGMVVSAVPTEEQMAALSGAGTGLLAEIAAAGGEDENVLLSPASILMALGMTENGADHNTLSEMEQVANGGIGVDSLNIVMAYLRQKMADSKDVNWNVANSVWLKDMENIELDDEFAKIVIAHYKAEIWKSGFDAGTVKDINEWVNQNTDGMIPEIIDSINPNTMMYLINAIAFDGEWEEEYEDDKIRENAQFKNADGTVSDVCMLYSTENRYFELGDGEGFVKPYKGGEFAFVGILPKEGVSTADYLQSIQKQGLDFSEAVREADTEEVHVSIPEFELDYGTDLSDTYRKLGMTEPFGMDADFSRMLAGGGNALYIGSILHKTHIEVDRKGTRAAAVTAVELRTKSAMVADSTKVIHLDRPFVYAIVDVSTGMPVFLGCQNSME